ncbi:patatin-like phospholipase family protein [Cyanobium sp. Lug-B]|uniref:patatin-like phospholipase family protein n=1 Tax=Cyanobium sp. Lug-B TaxID=2823716 RepID=UPI0020CC892F|nr:patatin-like phospholipase family protein [Cyanobium sp. Lug-B]MCP9797734.1 patatin-like phospholipase family protein [Cyanobium sp. Lug-B]
MPRKLAIVISGAVSLGSYEAGVMYEVLEAIALHNESVGADHPERVEIDVITGASAGAMTAAILSRQLYYGGEALRQPYHRNPLFNAWVCQINIEKLLKVTPDKHKYSLLSSDVIDDIGQKAIPDDPSQALDLHPAADKSLLLGIAMSNLNGYKQEIPGSKYNDSFAYSRYKDQFVCRLQRQPAEADPPGSLHPGPAETIHLSEMEPQMTNGKVTWCPMQTCDWGILRLMALSSGAFPFAFRARRIVRSGGSKKSMMATRDSGRKSSAGDQLYGGNYLYTDGGVFENEPVGMAANLIEAIGTGQQDLNRSYLFVAPGKRTIDADPFFNTEDDLLAMATGLISAIFGQSRFQQWVTEGLTGQLLTVTATEATLVGDTFSAFGGFLEFQFLAHDYNIGRLNARQKLRQGSFDHLINDYRSLDALMPLIDWPKPCPRNDRASSDPADSTVPAVPARPHSLERTSDGYGDCETDAWKAARQRLAPLARPRTTKADGARKRDLGGELSLLMSAVHEKRRKLIADQILARVDSLVGFAVGKLLDPSQARRRPVRFVLRLALPVLTFTAQMLLKPMIYPVISRYILHPRLPAEPPPKEACCGEDDDKAPSTTNCAPWG